MVILQYLNHDKYLLEFLYSNRSTFIVLDYYLILAIISHLKFFWY